MKRIALLTLTANLCLVLQPKFALAQKHDEPMPVEGYKLVFHDDFDSLDLSDDGTGLHTWYEGIWFHRKRAPLTNIHASESLLQLTWTSGQESPDTSITTASHDKRHIRSWRYGYFEARMKWDPLNGAWPAFWLIPEQDELGTNIYRGEKESGEIDIFEGQGDHPHIYYGTIHDWVNNHDYGNKENYFQVPDVDYSQYHIYGLLWVPRKVTWYLDGRALHSENTPAIVDKQDFFLVLGMQEGTHWKYGDLTGVTSKKMTLTVDWVRVWQRPENSSASHNDR